MANTNSKKGVITISVIAFFVITSVILYLSLSDYGNKAPADTTPSISSDALPGENNKEIKPEMTASEVQGYYIDDSDGWYYNFLYAPDDKYDGTFQAGYDQTHKLYADNPQKHFTANGFWKLESGEIKLYNELEYQQSMWVCGDYIVDSQNYFVGDVPKDNKPFQSVFVCKALESGDTQIFNFYSDGKLIMEIIRNDGNIDSASDNTLPPHQLVAGTYEKTDDKIITSIGTVSQEFYLLDDGIAKWIYHKRQ